MVRSIVLLFMAVSCSAFGAAVTARISKNPVGVGEVFSLTAVVSSDQRLEIEGPEWSKNIGPLIIQGSSRSNKVFSSFSYPGGAKKTIQYEFHYQLFSQKRGKWTIPPLQFIIDQKTYSTEPLSVTVSSKIAPSPKPPKSVFDFFQDQNFFKDPFFQGRKKDFISPGDLLLKAKVKSRAVYLGEMIFAKWELYRKQTAASALSLEEVNLIQPQNFWVKRIKTLKRLNFDDVENIKGENYLKADLSSYALFPLKTGSLTIHPLKIKVRAQNFFPFSPGYGKMIPLQSRPVSIEVLPLPEESKGEFTGAVGSFIIESSVDRNKILKDEILSYKIRFKGRGNVQMIQLPQWPEKSSFAVYDVLESQEFSIDKAWKEYEILLSPKKTGSLKTPELIWTVFDPSLKSYVSHHLPSHFVEVQTLKGQKQTSQLFFDKEDQKENKQPPEADSSKARFKSVFLKYQWPFYIFVLIFVYFDCSGKRSQKQKEKEKLESNFEK